MFNDLITLLTNNGLLNEVYVSALRNSPCDSSKRVIDFNSLKTIICRHVGAQEPKSVAAIFLDSQSALVFLQTESFYAADLSTDLASGEIHEKIKGTIDTLSHVIISYGAHTNFSSFYSSAARKKIETIILVSISDRDYLKIRLGYFDQLNIKAGDSIIGEIKLMSCEDFERHHAA